MSTIRTFDTYLTQIKHDTACKLLFIMQSSYVCLGLIYCPEVRVTMLCYQRLLAMCTSTVYDLLLFTAVPDGKRDTAQISTLTRWVLATYWHVIQATRVR